MWGYIIAFLLGMFADGAIWLFWHSARMRKIEAQLEAIAGNLGIGVPPKKA